MGKQAHRRDARWPLAAGLAAGVALDALIGDPRRAHPVAAFGRVAAALEARDYAGSRRRGAAHTAACVAVAAVPVALIQRRTRGRPLLRLTATAITAWAVTGARSLGHEAERTYVSLSEDDLPAAREILPSLCGRDPSGLGAKEIARAVIESVAENTSDAVVAPLLWGAVAGLPGLAAYRAINTLDAMIGHHTPRYERFGWAAARLDDAANWIPARVTALLTVACAPLTPTPLTTAPTAPMAFTAPTAPTAPAASDSELRGRLAAEGWNSPPGRVILRREASRAGGPGGWFPPPGTSSAWRALRKYGGQHPSPNAGRCEAAFAGALGIRLGGTNVYHGITETRPDLGDGRPPDPADIPRAIRLSRNVTLTATAVAVLIASVRMARTP
ncbi:MAG TPA: CobD/CbiB family cobalamin biosynthesis protein [Streptosporangiaceae bacterium]